MNPFYPVLAARILSMLHRHLHQRDVQKFYAFMIEFSVYFCQHQVLSTCVNLCDLQSRGVHTAWLQLKRRLGCLARR